MRPEPSVVERLRFMKLLATSGAGVLAGATPRARAKAGPPPEADRADRRLTRAMAKEIRAQKQLLEETLRGIRAYEPPTGSPPAYVFRAMRARKGG